MVRERPDSSAGSQRGDAATATAAVGAGPVPAGVLALLRGHTDAPPLRRGRRSLEGPDRRPGRGVHRRADPGSPHRRLAGDPDRGPADDPHRPADLCHRPDRLRLRRIVAGPGRPASRAGHRLRLHLGRCADLGHSGDSDRPSRRGAGVGAGRGDLRDPDRTRDRHDRGRRWWPGALQRDRRAGSGGRSLGAAHPRAAATNDGSSATDPPSPGHPRLAARWLAGDAGRDGDRGH